MEKSRTLTIGLGEVIRQHPGWRATGKLNPSPNRRGPLSPPEPPATIFF